MELQELGFRIPETVLTGDPLQAGFLAQNAWELVSKSCSSTKTRTVEMSVTDWARVDVLLDCPTLFQRRIRGDEVRLHWVAGRQFAERITTHRVDYRFADKNLPPNRHRNCEVPAHIARLCDLYCEAQALLFCGFDFKVDADENWFALEANPMPGYESYDRRQGYRIAHALIELLTSGMHAPAVPDAMRDHTTWKSHGGQFISDYSDAIYENRADGNEPMPLFIGEERRPHCVPFFHSARYAPLDTRTAINEPSIPTSPINALQADVQSRI